MIRLQIEDKRKEEAELVRKQILETLQGSALSSHNKLTYLVQRFKNLSSKAGE